MGIGASRRGFLKRLGVLAAGAGSGAGGLYYYGTRVETERLRMERVEMPVPDTGLDGFRIALLSDFHLYPHTKIELIHRAVDLANSFKPDLTLLGGDYVLKTAESIHELAPALAKLNAVHGVFGILGNHDHWRGAEVVTSGLERAGLPVLRNRGLTLQVGGSRLYLAGVDDGWVRRHNLAAAMDNLPSATPALVLMHEPDFADEFSKDPRVTLQLSGHSHGGQVRFPGFGSPFLPPYGRRYDQGLYRVGQMWLYTNVGVGVTVPIRLNCPPEVTGITLTA